MSDSDERSSEQAQPQSDSQPGVNRQQVMVSLHDGQQVKGYLEVLDASKGQVRILRPEEKQGNTVLDFGFEDMRALYYVADMTKKIQQLHIASETWNTIFQKRTSGTISLKKNQGKVRARFQLSSRDFGGVIVKPLETESNVLKVFYPFPKPKAYQGGKIGEKLLSEGFISQEELDAGLQKQSELRGKKIGDILVEEGGVQPVAVEQALIKQKSRIETRLGDILIAAGAVTQQQVDEALVRQKKNSTKRLGQILIDMGVISEDMLALSMALKFGLPFVDLTDYPVDSSALECVPEEMARRLNVFPVKLKNSELTVAIPDPTDLDPKQDLTFHTEKEIKEVVATQQGITTAIDEHYGQDQNDTDEYLEQLLADEAEIEEVSEKQQAEYELSEKTGREKPIIELVNHILKAAVKKKASDLHIVPEGRRVKVELRIDGVLREELSLGSERLPSVIARLKIMGNMNIAERRLPQDGRSRVKMGNKIVDLRFSCMPGIFGESMVVRLLDKTSGLMNLDRLGFLEKELREIREAQRKSYGMILVTGPTGSGKSSTIYACLQEDIFQNKNIVALEDPVEYELPGIIQVQIKESIGLTFAKGLRQILRHDPDVISVGEIRDVETAKIAIQSALTGHLLFSTLHTNTAAESFIRLKEMGVEPYLVSTSILGIISQRLIKKLCANCKISDERALEKLEASHYPAQPSADAVFYTAQGCDQCNQIGYKGRTVAYEYLIPNEEIKRGSIRNLSASELRSLAQKQQMRSMEQIALLKAEQGLTSVDEIIPLMSVTEEEERALSSA